MPRVHLILPLVLSATLTPGIVAAATPDAWEAFRADVRKQCLASLPEKLKGETVYVDPTGTESKGVALVSGRPAKAGERVTYICLYDKQKKTVEFSGQIGPEFVRVLNDRQREAFLAKKKDKQGTAATAAPGSADDEAE
ncbi:hypothetical protein [Sinorhizobium sp. BG8]|uniref:hypothetical protein n=1 Tax=Sinorhizobium sp. BG8 TaxID=2613773 RepID=UPI00193E3028|nr:hypothetical protein [Sinorhizobium sp. BG8]QRM54663.1 hypothetical protein F3Y30_08975 [Sinorhizobium sp. BG8]